MERNPDLPNKPGNERLMPDPMVILGAMAVAALTAAGLVLLGGWPRAAPSPVLAVIGRVLGAGLGFFAGSRMLGPKLHWPPQEDLDRFLLILIPALLGVELAVASILRGKLWLPWLPRLVLAAAAAPVLLYQSTFITNLGPGTPEWTPAQAALILGGLTAALAVVWLSLALVARKTPGRSVPLAVALTCAGAAVTIMLSGYASGGQIGLPLAAALAGATLASLALSAPFEGDGLLGLGVVGLFGLLVIGYFFGQLAFGHAVLLLFGLLFCWLPELPYLRRLRPRLRGFLRVVFVGVPVILAVGLAQQKFVADSSRTSPGSSEPSIQDYMNYGK
jgi:hypothetical protein